MKIKTLEILGLKDLIEKNKNAIKRQKSIIDDTITNFNSSINFNNKHEKALQNLIDQTAKLQEDMGKNNTLTIINLNTHGEKNFSDLKRFHLEQNIKHMKKHEEEIKKTFKKVIRSQKDSLKLHNKLNYIEPNKKEMSEIKNNIDSLAERFDNIMQEIK